MKRFYLILIIVFLIIAMFSFLNFFKDKKGEGEALVREGSDKSVSLNQEFELQQGDSASVGDLNIFYKNTTLPPDSYTGDREEFTYPQIEVTENGDTLTFPINTRFPTKLFHRYEIELLNMIVNNSERTVTLRIVGKEVNAKVLEEDAVKTALEEAEKKGLEDGEAINRILEYGLWKIEVGSKTISDQYVMVEIDSNTGEIRNSYRQNRA